VQLRFASGSLAQFLDIRYSAKVPSSSTVDDVQGTLEKYIPDDYYRTESEFLARVEEDAVSFRPPGEKIASYIRIAPDSKKKSKGAVVTLPEDDPDAIVYEVWHVRVLPPPLHFACRHRTLFDNCLRQRGTTQDSENITGGCNCSFCSTSRLALTSTMRKIHGSLSFCGFLSAPFTS
jgi:histone acetyltransferase HAT1-like protein